MSGGSSSSSCLFIGILSSGLLRNGGRLVPCITVFLLMRICNIFLSVRFAITSLVVPGVGETSMSPGCKASKSVVCGFSITFGSGAKTVLALSAAQTVLDF